MKKDIAEIIETIDARYRRRQARTAAARALKGKGDGGSYNGLKIQLQVLADIRAELDTVDSMTAAEYTEYLNA